MPIDLGLTRISKLLSIIGNPHIKTFRSIHVAGTNGKGSTIAYISSILTQAHIRNGRFTTPHLLEANDSICINEIAYPRQKFEEVKNLVSSQNDTLALGCTEFELLTATAFKIFQIEKVELAIIEVGLGGRLDATNVLVPPDAPHDVSQGGVITGGITKIGLDHEKLLGNSIGAIAKEKAGIIKKGMLVVVDGTNEGVVLEAVRLKAKEVNATVIVVNSSEVPRIEELNHISPLQGCYQIQNLALALLIVRLLRDDFGYDKLSPEAIKSGVERTSWPGRLQTVFDETSGITALIDGAHNENAAIELGKNLHSYRSSEDAGGIIFIVALSRGKSLANLLKHVTRRDNDTVFAATFSKPEDMPWVDCYLENEIADMALPYVNDIRHMNLASVPEMFRRLQDLRKGGDNRPIVFCGSLYLCSDILRWIRETGKADEQ